MEPTLVITEDGSSTIFIAALDEHYHSVHGAIQESVHVFINAGLLQKINNSTEINILEIGFGTGLNALLTCLQAEGKVCKINYTTIEKFPVSDEHVSLLNYSTQIEAPNTKEFFAAIHAARWEASETITNNFSIQKRKMNIEDVDYTNQFDLIYFDAFAPSAQPELWTDLIFASMYKALKPMDCWLPIALKAS
jgi:tRNA U34 5-methylaminomethyl-2-thiouridine-forming methyltransferase MnmC